MRDPLFILAGPRSFTSVICAMLGQHPEMYGLPEVNLFIAESMHERERIVSRSRWNNDGLLRAVAELYVGEQTAQSVLLARHWEQVRKHRSCTSVFRELLETLNDNVVVDKSISTIRHSRRIYRTLSAFPAARYLHLVRHPWSQCVSFEKIFGSAASVAFGGIDENTEPPCVDYQYAWLKINRRIVSFLAHLPNERKMRIRGEDLLSSPDEHLGKICEWLKLVSDSRAIEAMKHPERSPFACFGPVGARFGNDSKFLKNPVFKRREISRKPSLETRLPWRYDGGCFSRSVKTLAGEFGYT